MELQKILRIGSRVKMAGNNILNKNLEPTANVVSRSKASSSSSEFDEAMVVPKEEMVRFVADSLIKFGADKEDALTVGEHLYTADYRGHFSHGLNRMEFYIRDARDKSADPKAKPKIIHDFQAVAVVDGNSGFGHVTGNFGMRLAMRKAKEFGIGMVSCRGSNHYGIAGYYSLLAMRENLIGFSCTNTSPVMVPTRSRVAAIGTNPISLGAEGSDGDQFVLDMASTCVAVGKVEVAMRKGEPIPRGWALGDDGEPTTDAEVAFRNERMMPLGGEEVTSGYKGYGLALMVEILCGILSGSNFGPNIRKWVDGQGPPNLGHCFIAIDPERFYPGWKGRLDTLLKQMRDLPTVGDQGVLVPGDPERKHMQKVDEEGGISYHENQLKASDKMAKELGVEPMKLVRKKVSGKL